MNLLAWGGTADIPVISLTEEGLGSMWGTSVATAEVTGAASLVWAKNPDLSAAQVKEMLTGTATDLVEPGWDVATGSGLLNVDDALELAGFTQPEDHFYQQWFAGDSWLGQDDYSATERAVETLYGLNADGRRVYQGYLDVNNPQDVLIFEVDQETLLQFRVTNPNATMELYGPDGLIASDSNFATNASALLTPGNYSYLIQITAENDLPMEYEAILNFDNTAGSVVNEVIAVSSPDALGTLYGRKVQSVDIAPGQVVVYQFQIEDAAGSLNFAAVGSDRSMSLRIVSEDGTIYNASTVSDSNDELGFVSSLPPGTYYVEVENTNIAIIGTTNTIDLILNLDQAGNEPTNARNLGDVTGQRLELKDFVDGNRGDEDDWYVLQISSPTRLQTRFDLEESGFIAPNLSLYKGTATEPFETLDGNNANVSEVILLPGTYYAHVQSTAEIFGNYNLILNTQVEYYPVQGEGIIPLEAGDFKYRGF